jgi:hypothetical protein
MKLKFWKKDVKEIDYTNTISNAMNRVTGVNTGWQWGFNRFELELKTADLDRAYYNNPIVFKGINKKARDMIFSGFEIDCPLDGVDIPEKTEQDIKDFLNKQQIEKKMFETVREALYRRDGWFEYVCAGNKDPKLPLNGKLLDIVKVDTKTITGWKYKEDEKGNKKGIVEYWIQTINGKKTLIHASRLEHIQFFPQPDGEFGMSATEIASRAIAADNNATKALGDNLDMFGHPFPTINTTDNVNIKQVDDAYKALGKLKKKGLKVGFAGLKDTKFGLLNPANPSPEPSLKHFYIELAAALEMPMLLLTGSQMSKLTGNEIELDDYYKSIKSYQNIYLSPVFNKMFVMLLGENVWKDNYNIEWNQLYTNEESEISNKTKVMKEIGELYSKHGLVDIVEGRQLLREYGIEIPEGNPLDEPMDEDENDGLPFVNPPPSDDEDGDNDETAASQTWTIRRAKNMDLALERHLKAQGKKEIIEQEKRLKEAQKHKKK